MTSRRFLLAWILFFSWVVTPRLAAQTPAAQEEWIALFNGHDLDGWTPKLAGHELGDNYAGTFRVDQGVLKVSYDGYDGFGDRFGHLFYRDPFSHYILRMEYRFTGRQVEGGPQWAWRNSGAMIHCLDPRTMTREQDFPVSIEVQLLGGRDQGERPTANLCTPGTHVVLNGELFTPHCLPSASRTYRGDHWVTAEVEVHGGELIRHRVNGETVLVYGGTQVGGGNVSGHDPRAVVEGRALTSGYISLQSESHPIEFRKVELLNLKGCQDPRALNYKAYYVEPDPATCRYPQGER